MVKKIKEEITQVRGLTEYMTNPKENIKVYKRNKLTVNKPWWSYDKFEVHEAIQADITKIENDQTARRRQNILFTSLYANLESLGLSYLNMGSQSQLGNQNNRPTFNLVQSVVDAVGAKVGKDQPKVQFVTSGTQSFFLKSKANKLTKYMTGLFKKSDLYNSMELAFRDACVVGTGFIKIGTTTNGEITTTWCPNDEVRVDYVDGHKQKPRCMYQVCLIERNLLMSMYPDFADEIANVQNVSSGRPGLSSTIETISVKYAWHLPSNKKSKDGRYAVSIENATLEDTEYTKDYHEIVPIRWYSSPLNFYGRSITEEILGIQVEINKLLKLISQCQEMIACPIIFVPNEAEIATNVLMSNGIARMVPYSGGQPPTIVSPQALSQEIYTHVNALIQWGYQIVGLSQTSASGMKPAGVDSAVAIREVTDLETTRFAQISTRLEKSYVEIAEIMLDKSSDLLKQGKNISVNVSERKILKELSFKDVDIKDNPYEIQAFPVSQLPDTPAGRIQSISEMIANQWITKERGMELLHLDPDLEGEVDLQTASLRLTEKWLTEMAEDGVYHKPEKYMNLDQSLALAQAVYNQMIIDKLPEERLQLIRNFMEDIATEMAPPPAPPMPPGPAPMSPTTPVLPAPQIQQ